MVNDVRFFVLLVAAGLVSCADDPRELIIEGNRHLDLGDSDRARAQFASALDQLPEAPSEERYAARLGMIEAFALLEPERCVREFLVLAREQNPGPEVYSRIVRSLASENRFVEALTLLEHGLSVDPENAKLAKLLERIGGLHDEFVANRGQSDEAALAIHKRLRTLGYVGSAPKRKE